jgi:hypothetical protein
MNDLFEIDDGGTQLNGFFKHARQYLEVLHRLSGASPEALKALFDRLNYAAYSYVGFLDYPIVIGQPFVLKVEQILNAGVQRFPFYQGYKINLGFERAWHLEVICPSPKEIAIRASQNMIEIERCGTTFTPTEVLGVEEGVSVERHHYYKTRSWDEIERSLELKGRKAEFGFRPEITLWVRYRVDRGMFWAHILGLFIVIATAILFFLYADPKSLLPPNDPKEAAILNPLTWIALAVPLVPFVMALSEKETITAQRLALLKGLTMLTAGIMYCVFSSE